MSDRTMPDEPAPFTAADFAARLQRAAAAAEAAGLTGLLLTPGPDLLYLTGYAPVAITERITMLVVPVDGEPTMIVPKLERPDAEESPGASVFRLADWADGSDPYEATARLLRTGALRALGLGLGDAPARAPGPAARDVVHVDDHGAPHAAGDQGRRRARAAGRGRGGGRRRLRRDPRGPLRRPERDRGRHRAGRAPAPVRALAGRLHGRRLGSERGEPAPRDGRPDHRATATWWCSTSAASSTATGRTRPARCTSASPPTRSARCTRSSAARSRRDSRRSAPASSARRSTGPREP